MNAREWIIAYAGHLGIDPPTSEEWSQLLDLAAVAAHASERVAAPVSCWVAARAGISPQAAVEAARAISPSES